jgi:hypothetical protein
MIEHFFLPCTLPECVALAFPVGTALTSGGKCPVVLKHENLPSIMSTERKVPGQAAPHLVYFPWSCKLCTSVSDELAVGTLHLPRVPERS